MFVSELASSYTHTHTHMASTIQIVDRRGKVLADVAVSKPEIAVSELKAALCAKRASSTRTRAPASTDPARAGKGLYPERISFKLTAGERWQRSRQRDGRAHRASRREIPRR